MNGKAGAPPWRQRTPSAIDGKVAGAAGWRRLSASVSRTPATISKLRFDQLPLQRREHATGFGVGVSREDAHADHGIRLRERARWLELSSVELERWHQVMGREVGRKRARQAQLREWNHGCGFQAVNDNHSRHGRKREPRGAAGRE